MPDPFLCALSQTDTLPEVVRDLHSQPGRFTGRCSVERGQGVLVALALRLGGFPPSAQDIPVTVITQAMGAEWTWCRDFNGHHTRSRLTHDPRRGLVRERIGGLTIWMRTDLSSGRLSLEIKALSLFGCPCPRVLLPRSSTVEWQDDQGRFRFDVSAQVPGLGRLIRYQGWLTRDHGNRGAD
ncbi:DUF4166 domain-containing protein [Ruegeria sp.]|uniref:DUF4166 domain-containing protein n=1 Tax=Ruegeria sp. TaxID=1879320 RepID=UPI00231E081F|nr:DUF4166 domain-containing protein [Ruegeria sp.]MDA7963306.1 DUF4166 domain-containing protein [Ruegeria sp.]